MIVREHHNRTSSGFTLLELLVVLAILGIVTNIGLVAFNQITTMWSDVQAEAALERSIDSVFNAFQEDVSDTLSATLSSEAILGIDRETTSDKYFDRVLSDDMIVLPVQHSATGVRMRTGSKVAWRVIREGEVDTLVRAVGDLTDQIPSGGRQDMIGTANVVRLGFAFAPSDDPGTWLEEWSANEHPAAIKISIVLADLDRPWVQVGREAVFPVNVR